MFKKSNPEWQASAHTCYVMAYEIAKRVFRRIGQRISAKVAEIVCPDKQGVFQNVSLSQMTITRRAKELAET